MSSDSVSDEDANDRNARGAATGDSVRGDINIRASHYFVARTKGKCPRCHRFTPVVALGLPPGHEVLEPADDAVDGATAVDTWSVAAHTALLFDIDYLPLGVSQRLTGFAPAYRLEGDESAAERCWANHCDQCGARLSDQELLCEPGGAFVPFTVAEARFIALVAVHETLEAAASGYVHEPPFFAAPDGG